MDNSNQQIEIDVLLLLKKMWAKKFTIILFSTMFATVALAISLFVLTPQYTSSTRIYVVNQNSQNNSITTQDLQVGDYLVKDYQQIITSKDVLATVVDTSGLDMMPEQLASKVSVSVPTSTRIIAISVTDASPAQAAYLANAVREIAAEKIKQITKVEEVTTLENAEEPLTPSSPNIKRNTLLGALVGGFLAVVMVLLREILDDRIKRSEDIEEVLGLPLLGIVPDITKVK